MTSSLSQKSRLALLLRALLYSFQSLWRWVVKVLFIVFTPNLLDLDIPPPSCYNHLRNNAVFESD